jgi:hypothetical protein
MKNKRLQRKMNLGRCYKCDIAITEDNLGDELAKGRICKPCYIEYLKEIIPKFDKVRQTKDFDDWNKLKIILLDFDEVMGGLHDTGKYQQTADYYNGLPLNELKTFLLDKMITFIKELQELTKSKEFDSILQENLSLIDKINQQRFNAYDESDL